MGVVYEKRERVAYFTLNRPEELNSLDPPSLEELSRAFLDFRDDPEVWVGIITGAGERAFSAGLDVIQVLPKALDPTAPEPYHPPATIMRGITIFKPLIAAINGIAMGAGLEIALACDIRLAAEGATMGLPEVRLGLMPGGGGTQRLPRMLPAAKAAEMLLMARTITAEEALRLGLVNAVVLREQLLPTATQWAQDICKLGPLGVRAAKEAMLRGLDLALDEGLRLEQMLFDRLRFTEDAQEGPRAFAQKRPPKFTGQ